MLVAQGVTSARHRVMSYIDGCAQHLPQQYSVWTFYGYAVAIFYKLTGTDLALLPLPEVPECPLSIWTDLRVGDLYQMLMFHVHDSDQQNTSLGIAIHSAQ